MQVVNMAQGIISWNGLNEDTQKSTSTALRVRAIPKEAICKLWRGISGLDW